MYIELKSQEERAVLTSESGLVGSPQSKAHFRDFLGGPVVKTLPCQFRGQGFDPWHSYLKKPHFKQHQAPSKFQEGESEGSEECF